MRTWTEEKLQVLRVKARMLGLPSFIMAKSRESRTFAMCWVDNGEFSIHKQTSWIKVSKSGYRWPALRVEKREMGVSLIELPHLLRWLNAHDARVQPNHRVVSDRYLGRMQR